MENMIGASVKIVCAGNLWHQLGTITEDYGSAIERGKKTFRIFEVNTDNGEKHILSDREFIYLSR